MTNDWLPEAGEPPRGPLDGATFVFDAAEDVPAVWGRDQQVAWAEGEGLMLVGPDGVGKTALQQQLVLARIGLRAEVLGLPVRPAEAPVLYIAADRPPQAARSLRRMVAEDDRAALAERLIVWKGPLPFDLATEPAELARFAKRLGVNDVFIDALKDVALDLSKDETGSRVNRALQETIAAGIEVCAAHHQRKEQNGGAKPRKLADVYGSRWLTAGMGSVVLLWGEAGDLVVDVSHLKQPAEDIGPFRVLHDHRAGSSTVYHPLDLEELVAKTYGGLTAKAAATALYGSEKPAANEVEKARRRLEGLVAKGTVYKDELTGTAHYFARRP